MTDHEGNRKIYLAQGIQEGLETVDYCPTESREPDGFFCWPRDQSLFVLLYHYMPTVNKIAIHKKLNKNLKKYISFNNFFK